MRRHVILDAVNVQHGLDKDVNKNNKVQAVTVKATKFRKFQLGASIFVSKTALYNYNP